MQDSEPQLPIDTPLDSPASPALEMLQLAVGRFQVPEDADDMLGMAHRLPGVVHVWLNGSMLHLECVPGAVDRDAIVERLRDVGYPIRSA